MNKRMVGQGPAIPAIDLAGSGAAFLPEAVGGRSCWP